MEQRNMFMALTLLSGGAYTSIGILILLTIIGIVPFGFVSGDALTGLMILIVGVVFLEGVKNLRNAISEAIPFLIVGLILAGIVAALQVAILLSNALGWIIDLDGWNDWQIVNDLTAAIWLSPTVIPLLVAMYPFSERILRKEEEVT